MEARKFRQSAEMITVKRLLELSFEIPRYQRAYDWEAKHVTQLMSDIIEHTKDADTRTHFLGTIVCTPSSGGRVFVVDGQQRITSLILLLSYLERKRSDRDELSENSSILQVDGSIKLLPQEQDQTAFNDFIRQSLVDLDNIILEHKATRAQVKMGRAIQEIREKLEDECGNDVTCLEKIHITTLEKTRLVLIQINSGSDAARLFETINNRGKPVSELDLIKNYLIDLEQRILGGGSQVVDTWRGIESTLNDLALSDDDADFVLQAVVTAMTGSHRRKGTSNTQIIREYIKEAHDRGKFQDFLKFLGNSYECFRKMRQLKNPDEHSGYKRQLAYLNYHASISGILPIILACYQVGKRVPDETLLALVEKTNFRLYGLRSNVRADKYSKQFAEFAQQHLASLGSTSLAIGHSESTSSSASLSKNLESLLKREQVNFPDAVLRAIVLSDDDPFDYYHWPWLGYFLARWESYLAKKMNQGFNRWPGLRKSSAIVGQENDLIEREHIYVAKSKKASSQDGAAPSHLANYGRGLILRRLGNFVLCPKLVNIELSNNEVKRKLEITNNTKVSLPEGLKKLTLQFEEAAKNAFEFKDVDVEEFEILSALHFIDKREHDYAEFTMDTWGLEGEDQNRDFSIQSIPDRGSYKSVRKELDSELWTYVFTSKVNMNYKWRTTNIISAVHNSSSE